MPNFKFSYNSTYFIKRLVVILLFFSLGNSVFSQNIPVPENIQAALLTKVLKYNPQIPQNKRVRILIVYDNSSQNSKDEFIKGLGGLMDIKAVYPSEIEQNITNFHAVYFMTEIQNYAALCKKYKILSVTGLAKYVEQGEISLGFVTQNNKPIIVINLTSLDREGQSFSSDILRISKIYK